MLKAYFDDSGTHSTSAVVVIGGLIGTGTQWEYFERSWVEELKCPLPGKSPLKKFHLSVCNAGEGEFSDYSRAERDRVIHDFRHIIQDARLISVAAAVDREAYDQFVTGENRNILGDALQPCFENCLWETNKIAQAHPEGSTIWVVFDKGIYSPTLKTIADEATYPLGNPRFVSITFGSVEEILPLQGADITATESNWAAQDWIKLGPDAKPRAHLADYLKHIPGMGQILSREKIAELILDMDQQRASSKRQPS
jgi:hypothetical protein